MNWEFYFLLVAFNSFAIEIIFKLNLIRIVRDTPSQLLNGLQTLFDKSQSDIEKELALTKVGLATLKSACALSMSILGLAACIFVIDKWSDGFFYFIMSFEALGLAGVFSLAYVYLRRRFND